MPNLPHLILPRAEYELPRKKTGYGRPPQREHGPHGSDLSEQVDEVLTTYHQRRRPAGFDPTLILRVQLHPQAGVDEEVWERCGLVLLSIDENKTLILFSSDAEMTEFRRKLAEYQAGPPPDQKGAPHQQIFAAVDAIGDIRPEDRIGRLLRASGVSDPAQIDDDTEYVVDVELWDLGDRTLNERKVDEIRTFVRERGGRVTDYLLGESLILLRVRGSGALLKSLCDVEYIASVDLPPAPTLTVGELLDVGIEDLPEIPEPGPDAPAVAVLDSGLTAAHPLIRPAVGEATTVPRAWGDASDGHGHGTMVAGLALYGDVAGCIRNRSFVPRLTLYSARVLNDACKFDDERLITTQMREAIEYFRGTYGCRVFSASLGDARLPYRGGKVSPWASVLDTLARELDVVIIVSAGNTEYDPGDGGSPDGHVQEYPRYLLNPEGRIIEPATGAIVLTVGSLAESADLPPGTGNNVALRPIARPWEPSPFTRCGPGLGGSVKPELVEVGGNAAYDGMIQRVRQLRNLSVISMNREYATRLFTTDFGTSFAAPRVAHAAARLLESFPEASANLIRALLAVSAKVPEPSVENLQALGGDAVTRVCGYGRADLARAERSEEGRAVLYSDAAIAFDNFHIYEVPIPEEFVEENGTRSVSVALAFDPPVRHTRFDYLGARMSFRLIRGKEVGEIAEAFRQRTREEPKVDRLTSTSYDCPMIPRPTAREGGTLQKATFTMKRRPGTDYGDTYYLVVRCERKWARDEHGPQRYAVAVVLEHSAEVNLYNRIRTRVRQTERLRARQRAGS